MYKTYIKQIELEFHDGQVRLKDTSVHSNDLEGLNKGIIGKCKENITFFIHKTENLFKLR